MNETLQPAAPTPLQELLAELGKYVKPEFMVLVKKDIEIYTLKKEIEWVNEGEL